MIRFKGLCNWKHDYLFIRISWSWKNWTLIIHHTWLLSLWYSFHPSKSNMNDQHSQGVKIMIRIIVFWTCLQIFSQLTGLLARNVLRDFVIVDPEKTEPWLFVMSDYCHYGAHAIHQNHSSMIISDKDEHHDTNLNNWNYLLHIEHV